MYFSQSEKWQVLTSSLPQLFMAAVGLLFAPVAPLVPLAAAVLFWIGSWVYKYQLIYCFTTKVESGGVSFPVCYELDSV